MEVRSREQGGESFEKGAAVCRLTTLRTLQMVDLGPTQPLVNQLLTSLHFASFAIKISLWNKSQPDAQQLQLPDCCEPVHSRFVCHESHLLLLPRREMKLEEDGDPCEEEDARQRLAML